MDSSLHPDVDLTDRPYCHLHDPRQCDRQVNRPVTVDVNLLAQLLGEQSRLRVILFGYPEDVNREILSLHPCGYDIDAWSEPQRIPGSIEVMAAYIKPSRRLVH